MSHKINRSFKLLFWGVELGEFQVKGEINSGKYSVSTNASGKSLVRLLSNFEISSGAVGNISDQGNLIPSQFVSRWRVRGKIRESKLDYIDGELIRFTSSPELEKKYHIGDPTGIDNTIDPVSLIFWLLSERDYNQICKQRIRILDGFRMSELSFQSKNVSQEFITCSGKIERILGFKESEFKKKPLGFKIIYSFTNPKKIKIFKIEVETTFGKLTVL